MTSPTLTATTTPPEERCVSVLRIYPDHQIKTQDIVVEEVPVALIYNGISHVILMATPSHLEELALGFSLSEGILTDASQLYDCEISVTDLGIEVSLQIASAQFASLKEKRRAMTGRTGCGICGIDSLTALNCTLSKIDRAYKIPYEHIVKAIQCLDAWQPLRQKTGAVHGAAWINTEGNIILACEDVGRHNALDKLIGSLKKDKLDLTTGFILISSRASYEMVQKTAQLGIGCLVAVSAPTALAVRLAEQSNITLIGFSQEKRQVIYTHEQYLKDVPQPKKT